MGLFTNEASAAGHRSAGPLRQLADVERVTTDFAHWDNHGGLHDELGDVAPEEREQAYYAAAPDPPAGESTADDGMKPGAVHRPTRSSPVRPSTSTVVGALAEPRTTVMPSGWDPPSEEHEGDGDDVGPPGGARPRPSG